jgi:hypothetical protein
MRRISEPIRIFTLHLFCKQNSLFLISLFSFFVLISLINFSLPIFVQYHEIYGFDNAYTQLLWINFFYSRTAPANRREVFR